MLSQYHYISGFKNFGVQAIRFTHNLITYTYWHKWLN